MEPLLDKANPLHVVIVSALVLTGLASAWIGVRDGFVRREVRTNSGLLLGAKAMLAGALYVATGLLAAGGGIAFFLKARG